jgi:iron complex outermembrane receptor protein
VPQVENIGNIDVVGAEADFRFLIGDAFELFGSLSVLDTEVKESIEPALVGNNAPMAAETSGSLGGKYTVAMGTGDLDLSAVYTYSDSFFFDIENTFEQPSYSTIDARAAWANDRWGVALIGENLADEEYLAESFLFLDVTNIRAWGRLVRLEAHLNF